MSLRISNAIKVLQTTTVLLELHSHSHYKAAKALVIFTFFSLALPIAVEGQDSTSFYERSSVLNKKRLTTVAVGSSLAFTGAVVSLNEVWYKNYPKSSFHVINDNGLWMGMDKLGHATTSYYLGDVGYNLLKWSGVNDKTSAWIGGSYGLIFLTTIEVLDGHSAEWGFSWGDQVANTLGAGMFISQQLGWKEQRIRLKFSAHLTEYAAYRPETLGNTTAERLLKDYNGQTYWLSVNPNSFGATPKFFPKWLNVAFGYGASEMLKGDTKGYNFYNSETNSWESFSAYRQYYLSFDIDFEKLPLRTGFARTLLKALNVIKIPFPAVEFNKNGVYWHWLYF